MMHNFVCLHVSGRFWIMKKKMKSFKWKLNLLKHFSNVKATVALNIMSVFLERWVTNGMVGNAGTCLQIETYLYEKQWFSWKLLLMRRVVSYVSSFLVNILNAWCDVMRCDPPWKPFILIKFLSIKQYMNMLLLSLAVLSSIFAIYIRFAKQDRTLNISTFVENQQELELGLLSCIMPLR